MMRAVLSTLVGLGLAAALTGCGRQSDLDRPAPLWGAKAKADWGAAHRPATNAAATNGIPPLPPDETEDNSAPNGPPTPP